MCLTSEKKERTVMRKSCLASSMAKRVDTMGVVLAIRESYGFATRVSRVRRGEARTVSSKLVNDQDKGLAYISPSTSSEAVKVVLLCADTSGKERSEDVSWRILLER